MIIKNTFRLCLSVILSISSISSYAELTQDRKQQLEHLLKHDCGSCHGMTRKGGLGPALLSDNLKNKSDEFLFLTIQHGRPGTPMPPWSEQLSNQDINWIVHLLRANKPNE